MVLLARFPCPCRCSCGPCLSSLCCVGEQRLRHATYTASINHHDAGEGYTLTPKMPTWRHHCLAHVLSVANTGTVSADTEVWGGPLSGGAYVAAFVNRGSSAAQIALQYSMFEVPGVGASSAFRALSLWDGADLGAHTGGFTATVPARDITIVRLTPS